MQKTFPMLYSIKLSFPTTNKYALTTGVYKYSQHLKAQSIRITEERPRDTQILKIITRFAIENLTRSVDFTTINRHSHGSWLGSYVGASFRPDAE